MCKNKILPQKIKILIKKENKASKFGYLEYQTKIFDSP